ncbi:hypothetical protein [Sabulicella glaciei]|uniref:Uncharacterized protein n=1 Tax=Sabulicella glaciei TaxID=2984948 RepID=A0ABT3NSV4_9PROT|nr:hypothetical protein [Roseococcus sp. MDT2-1-1]MCW8085244.1 hypothetical protein [Roseococcus sp. MDT2-1-1]
MTQPAWDCDCAQLCVPLDPAPGGLICTLVPPGPAVAEPLIPPGPMVMLLPVLAPGGRTTQSPAVALERAVPALLDEDALEEALLFGPVAVALLLLWPWAQDAPGRSRTAARAARRRGMVGTLLAMVAGSHGPQVTRVTRPGP